MDESNSPIGTWLAHIISIFAIGGSFFGLIPAVAALLAVIWYLIEIYESRTIQKLIRVRRLRKLVRLRAKAVALELLVRNQNFDLRGLDEANQVHLAAAGKAAELTHEALVVEQMDQVQQQAEDENATRDKPDKPKSTPPLKPEAPRSFV